MGRGGEGTAAAVLITLLTSGCAVRLHEPSPDLDPSGQLHTWSVHCETARSHDPVEGLAPGAHHERWVWARDEQGRDLHLWGELEDGFLVVEGWLTGDEDVPLAPPPTMDWLRRRCLETMRSDVEDGPLELGRVTAARRHEGLDVPLVLRLHERVERPPLRVVVFGDSLSDTGLLKRRLRVFPRPPYWLGRFSNGPVWVDYVEVSAGFVVQNHAYGGAAITHHEALPGEGLIERLEERGQFFVSGSTGRQVEDYLAGRLVDRTLRRPEETVFVFWAGANEYISKEPISSVITTFLNRPDHETGYERVADEAIAALEDQVRALHAAGGRRFVVINLPDLGFTPIVLQNEGYLPAEPVDSEPGRRLELAWRLSALTAYHNDALSGAVERLRASLPDLELIELDTREFLDALFEERLDRGFTLEPQRAVLTYRDRTRPFHHPCYTGRYLGTKDEHKVCDNEATALFWDVVHPTSYAHCWQSWYFERALADAGWAELPRSADEQRTWCRTISERTLGIEHSGWMFAVE